jgi:dolichyl-phosphate-mannose--protein O-mannosyl transferase
MNPKFYKYLIFSLFILFIVLRLIGTNQPIYDDETNFVESVNNPGPYLTIQPISIHAHPPVAGWIYLGVGMILGQEVLIYRLIPILFGILNLFLVYRVVKEYYSERSALFSLCLMGFSFYHLIMSLEIEIEGSVLVTTFLLMTYFYLKFQKSQQRKYLIYTGIVFGFSLLTKISALFFLGVIGIHLYFSINEKSQLIKFQHIKETFISFMMIMITGFALFSFYPLLMWDHFQKVLSHGSGYYGINISLMAIAMLLFWATPFLLGPFFLQIFKFNKKDSFWTIWFLVIFSIYTFLIVGRPGTHGGIGGVADYSRFFMNLVVPMSILGGVYLSKIRFSLQEKVIGLIGFGIFLGSFFYINYNTINILPRDFGIYLNALKNLKLNFLFPYTTSSGNLMGVSFAIIVITLFIVFLLLFFSLITKESLFKISKKIKIFFVIFISISIALNIFLVVEYLGPVTSPDINNVFYEMVDYTKNNLLKDPIYANNEGLLIHLNDLEYELGEKQEYVGVYLESIEENSIKSGSYLILDWPKVLIGDKLNYFQSCTKKETFSSKGIELGVIYSC